jgi:NADH-quinone oxidoreductase subunit G
VLPAATFAEADGTLVNNEGRAQRFFKVMVPQNEVQESWQWLRDMMTAAGRADAHAWRTFDDIVAAMAEAMPAFRAVPAIAPPAGFRMVGQKIPRQPHRYSGRTAIVANVTVHEPRPPADEDSPLAFSMEGYEGVPPGPLISRYWAPGWNSVQAVSRCQSEVGGPLLGGDVGKRLIEPRGGAGAGYFHDVPHAFERRDDEWLIVPTHHIFGSEELGVLSPGIAALAPRPYLALCPEDAVRLGVGEGELVDAATLDAACRLPVKVVQTLPAGVAGFPSGLPDSEGPALYGWARIRRVIREGAAPKE